MSTSKPRKPPQQEQKGTLTMNESTQDPWAERDDDLARDIEDEREAGS